MPADRPGAAAHGASVAQVRGWGGPFVVAVETTRMPMLFTDARQPHDPVVFANQSFLGLAGYAREEVLGRQFRDLLTDRCDVSVPQEAASAGACHGPTGPEIEIRRKDGGAFRAVMLASAVHDEKGAVVQHFISLVDMTRLHADRDHLGFLLDELNHRDQNLFTMLIEMVRHTLHGRVEDAVSQRLTARIFALSRAQNLLQHDHAEGVGLRRMLASVLCPPLMDRHVTARFLLEGEEVLLPNKAAVPMAMAFHELAANAITFGAASRAEGRVRIHWRVRPGAAGPTLALRWEEAGGPPMTPPQRRGFGLRLTETGLRHGLGGEAHVAFAPGGLVCDVTLPLRPAAQPGSPAAQPGSPVARPGIQAAPP